MADALLRCRFEGGAFIPHGPYQARRVAEQFGEGEHIELEVRHERSDASHRHEFGWLREAWRNLPERYANEWWAQSLESLRAYALIMTRWCEAHPIVCTSKRSARALANDLAPLIGQRFGKHVMAVVDGRTVTILVPRSQAYRAMNKKDFEASKAANLAFIADLLGITPEELGSVQAAASERLTVREVTALNVVRDGVTLDELGTDLNVSRERARQIQQKAFRKIRANARRDGVTTWADLPDA